MAIVIGALVLEAIASGLGVRNDAQGAADLAALAGARAMREAYPRVFTPPGPGHLDLAGYLALGRAAARETAGRNGAHELTVVFPDHDARDPFPPLRIAVTIADGIEVGGKRVDAPVTATAKLATSLAAPAGAAAGAGQYTGPLATRQGKRMRPDVAVAFDRMAAAARADGIALLITSAFRTDAEQATLFAAHPDPKWVAPPGKSLHRLGTELDLGPPSAYAWLHANAPRFHFIQRYSYEDWHYGL